MPGPPAKRWTGPRRFSRLEYRVAQSLPYLVREGSMAYCHGSPLEPEQFDYVFEPEHIEELMPLYSDWLP